MILSSRRRGLGRKKALMVTGPHFLYGPRVIDAPCGDETEGKMRS